MDDRNLNLLLFGFPESSSILDLKNVVYEIFEFFDERPVQIRDVCRLGKHNTPSSGTHLCPFLIKLSSTWDCKVLLRNLQVFMLKHCF